MVIVHWGHLNKAHLRSLVHAHITQSHTTIHIYPHFLLNPLWKNVVSNCGDTSLPFPSIDGRSSPFNKVTVRMLFATFLLSCCTSLFWSYQWNDAWKSSKQELKVNAYHFGGQHWVVTIYFYGESNETKILIWTIWITQTNIYHVNPESQWKEVISTHTTYKHTHNKTYTYTHRYIHRHNAHTGTHKHILSIHKFIKVHRGCTHEIISWSIIMVKHLHAKWTGEMGCLKRDYFVPLRVKVLADKCTPILEMLMFELDIWVTTSCGRGVGVANRTITVYAHTPDLSLMARLWPEFSVTCTMYSSFWQLCVSVRAGCTTHTDY